MPGAAQKILKASLKVDFILWSGEKQENKTWAIRQNSNVSRLLVLVK
jgi:hypothetical protein